MRSSLAIIFALATLTACGDKAEVAPASAPVSSAPVPAPEASAPAAPLPDTTPATSVEASSTAPTAAAAAPVVNPGKLKYVAVCQGCHGRNGAGQGPFPKLAGVPAADLIGKLNDYRAGKQVGPQSSTMMPFAKPLSDAEIESIATYLTTL